LALADPELVRAVLDDLETARVDERLRATLRLLGKLTLDPQGVGPADVRAVRAAGVEDAALAEAICVCALFNMIDRCADALGFDLPDDFAPGGTHPLLERGYLAAFPASR
jgi:alkylhydroperoxidase family enzyme